MEYRIIDLISSIIKNLGIPSFDRKNENENYSMKLKYQIARILKTWRTRNFTAEDKTTIFKTITNGRSAKQSSEKVNIEKW